MREFLARNEVPHRFVDVRKAPLTPKETVALVRKHASAISKVGGKLREIEPKNATDAEIEKLFLGREGTMRAPVTSNGTTIFAGFDPSSFEALMGG